MTTDRLTLAERLRGCVNRHEHESEAADALEKADALARCYERASECLVEFGNARACWEWLEAADAALAAYRSASKEEGT